MELLYPADFARKLDALTTKLQLVSEAEILPSRPALKRVLQDIPLLLIVAWCLEVTRTADEPFTHSTRLKNDELEPDHDGDSPKTTRPLNLPLLQHFAEQNEECLLSNEFKLMDVDAHELFGIHSDLGQVGSQMLNAFLQKGELSISCFGADKRGRPLVTVRVLEAGVPWWKIMSVNYLMVRDGGAVIYPDLTRRARGKKSAISELSYFGGSALPYCWTWNYVDAFRDRRGIHNVDDHWPLLPQEVRAIRYSDLADWWEKLREGDLTEKYLEPRSCVWGCGKLFNSNLRQLYHRCKSVHGLIATAVFRPDKIDKQLQDKLLREWKNHSVAEIKRD